MLTDAYRNTGSFVHGADPRAKMLLLTCTVVASLLPIHLGALAVLALASVLLSLVALGPSDALRPLRTMLPVLVILVVFTPLFYPEGSAIVSIRGYPVLTLRGAQITGRFLLRLVGIAELFYLFFRSTPLDALIASARWFGVPYAACLAVGVAVRLVPSTAALYTGVLDSLGLRQPEGGKRRRGLRQAARRVLPAVSSVLVHSVKSILVLSMALETRGVGRRGPRTSYVQLGPLPRMLLHLAVGLLVLGAPPALAVLALP